jgi:hypothetical protein
MSEHDDGGSYVGIVIIVILTTCLIVWVLADYAEIRDLQRRVGQLESERR